MYTFKYVIGDHSILFASKGFLKAPGHKAVLA